MLILTRKEGQNIFLCDKHSGMATKIIIDYLGIGIDGKARIGITAPKNIKIVRGEFAENDREEYRCDKSINVHYKDGCRVNGNKIDR